MSKKKTTAPRRKGKPWTKAQWQAWEDQSVARLLAVKDDEDDDYSWIESLPELPPIGPNDTIAMFGVRRPAAKTVKPRKRSKASQSNRPRKAAKSSRT